MAEAADENNEDVINLMSLNCGENPNLTDLDMNRISDDVNYICNDLLFLEILREENNDVKELLDKHVYSLKENKSVDANDKRKIDDMLFEGQDAAFLKKRRDFAISLENLSEKLDSINTKKDNYAFFENVTHFIIVIYVMFYVWNVYKFQQGLRSDDFKEQADAEKYNIGFVSNIAYIYMLFTLSNSFFQYTKLNATMGDLDTSVCSGVSDLVVSLKSIYQESGYYLEKIQSNQNADDCKTKVLRQMYKVYYLKYIKNIFIAAQSEFKQTVNSINKFISKQKKFLLKADNIDTSFTNDNVAFEEFYNILLHNHGVKLFKSTKSPIEKREEISKGYRSTAEHTHYENFLKDKLLEPYMEFLFELNSYDSKSDTKKLKEFMLTLDMINEQSLPEYKECLELIFPLEMQDYTSFSISTYVSFVRQYFSDGMDDLRDNTDIDNYFKAVREFHVKDGVLVTSVDSSDVESLDTDLSLKVMFTRIQQRKSNTSTIIAKYRDFQKAARTRVIIAEDLDDPKYFKEVFEMIRQHFIELTTEYKLNENIIMRFMTANLKEDETFEDDAGKRALVLSNIKFIVNRIDVNLKISQKFRSNVLDGTGINMNKYISFLKFENKLQQLDDEDLSQLNKYVHQTNLTIRSFRKYVKSEEILFSKKFQKMAIYNDIWQSALIGSGILLIVKFTAMFGWSDRKILGMAKALATDTVAGAKTIGKNATKGAKSVAKGVSKGAQSIGKSTSSAYQSAKSKFTKKSTASTATSTPGSDPDWREFSQGGDGEGDKKQEDKKKNDNKGQTDPDDKEEDDWMSITVKVSSMIVLYAIFFTFVYSYITKHKADLQYDKVVNVLNTTKFEYEFSKLTRYFNEYTTQSKSSKNCKKVYHSLIMVCEIYDKCNFIKSSMKRTPFPATEMWTNGVVMAVFLGIIYVAFIGTGVSDYWKNKDRLDQLVKDIEKTFSVGKNEGAIPATDDLQNEEDYPDEKIKQMLESRDLSTDGDREELIKRLDDALGPQRKDQEESLRRAMKASKKERRKQKDKFESYLENDQYAEASTELRKYLSDPMLASPVTEDIKSKLNKFDDDFASDDSREGLRKIINELFSSKELSKRVKGKAVSKKEESADSNAVGNQSGGDESGANSQMNNSAMNMGMMSPYGMGMGMGMGMMNMQMNSDAVMQKEMLKDYMNRYQNINAQLISMERESGYLNLVLAASILLFGTYFCTKILGNTDRYQSLLTSGGTFLKDCL
tara:strand:- start:2841 stop:6539 length:3699 start_codon:yes stop_codon:yes gene_type:complete